MIPLSKPMQKTHWTALSLYEDKAYPRARIAYESVADRLHIQGVWFPDSSRHPRRTPHGMIQTIEKMYKIFRQFKKQILVWNGANATTRYCQSYETLREWSDTLINRPGNILKVRNKESFIFPNLFRTGNISSSADDYEVNYHEFDTLMN